MKNNLIGWKDVYIFTLRQTLKNKVFVISFVVLLVLSLMSMPMIAMLTSSSGETEDGNIPYPIKKVYVINETSFEELQFSNLIEDETLRHITFETIKEDYEMIENRIEKEEHDALLLRLRENEGMYALDFVKSGEGTIENHHLIALSSELTEQFQNYLIETMQITDEQVNMIRAEVLTKVFLMNSDGSPIEDTSITLSSYWFIYGVLFIVLLVNLFAGTQIATSIITEKSTRVIEYLLTSIKPLAIIVGKIMAMLTAVLLQLLTMVIVLFISNKLSIILFSRAESVFSQYIPNDILENLNIINIVLCVLTIILGLIFYSTLAGLTGATVSKIEEVSEGLVIFTFTNIIGVYIGLGAAAVLSGSGVNGFVVFTFLFPLSSPFILPGAILVGRVNAFLIIGAILLQILFIVLLFLFVARVYETLILHNGNKIKIKDLIKISRMSKQEKEEKYEGSF